MVRPLASLPVPLVYTYPVSHWRQNSNMGAGHTLVIQSIANVSFGDLFISCFILHLESPSQMVRFPHVPDHSLQQCYLLRCSYRTENDRTAGRTDTAADARSISQPGSGRTASKLNDISLSLAQNRIQDAGTPPGPDNRFEGPTDDQQLGAWGEQQYVQICPVCCIAMHLKTANSLLCLVVTQGFAAPSVASSTVDQQPSINWVWVSMAVKTLQTVASIMVAPQGCKLAGQAVGRVIDGNGHNATPQ